MSVAAIVPARDEAARIADTVKALRTIAALDEVIVVDDASTDQTAPLAEGAGARVVTLTPRRGKGGALRAGIASTDADVLVFIDGDLGPSAVAAAVLVEPVLVGAADMTIAAPPRDGTSGFGLVEGTARAAIRAIGGLETSRPLSGQRALRRVIVERFPPADGFGVEVGLTLDALRAGYRVLEVPCAIEHRRTGRDVAGFTHRARQGLHVLRAVAPRVFRGGRGRT